MDEETKEKVIQLFSFYKFPLVLAGIGILFLVIGIAFLIKTQHSSSDVVFSSGESSPSAKIQKAKIHVDVEGAVVAPGVYKVEEGSRITGALAAAGGLSAEADREWVARNLNMAAKLVDGGKVYIPSVTEVNSGQTPFASAQGKQNIGNLNNASNLLGITAGKVNINSASQAEIEGLPSVGPVTAGRIISGRPYQTIDELKSKKIVGNAVFNKIKDLITAY